jgi:hypothetical protein
MERSRERKTAAVERYCRPFGAHWNLSPLFQGLTPLAMNCHPFGVCWNWLPYPRGLRPWLSPLRGLLEKQISLFGFGNPPQAIEQQTLPVAVR